MKAANDTERTFAIITFGCKVNQYESEEIAASLKQLGWKEQESNEKLNLCIINTCTVTQKSSMQARQAIRAAICRHPDACIVATGCYAQTEPSEIEKIKGVNYIIGQSEKSDFAEIINSAFQNHQTHIKEAAKIIRRDISCANDFRYLENISTGKRSRPFLKIQDGCNAFCSYCIVPYARGKSRSLHVAKIIEQINKVHESGFSEVVLTGIHLGSYGLDLLPKTSLSQLLYKIFDETSIPRIRLSSIEPNEINDDIINTAAYSSRLCNHFHIPLQSGNDRILNNMNRHYTSGFFKELVFDIYNRVRDCAIGLDVLAGFPGETEDEFQNTFDLIEEMPVSYLHIFPFSPRKGTKAFNLPDQISTPIIKKRCEKIRKLGIRKKIAFYQSLIGKELDVLIEEEKKARSKMIKGISSNYVPVLINSDEALKNKIIKVKIKDVVIDQSKTPAIYCLGIY